MWDLSQNYGPTVNVLMHIIIYSIVYEKKRICIRIGSAGFCIYFGISATVKLLEKNTKATLEIPPETHPDNHKL